MADNTLSENNSRCPNCNSPLEEEAAECKSCDHVPEGDSDEEVKPDEKILSAESENKAEMEEFSTDPDLQKNRKELPAIDNKTNKNPLPDNPNRPFMSSDTGIPEKRNRRIFDTHKNKAGLISEKKSSSFEKSRSSNDDREFSTITEGRIRPVSANKPSSSQKSRSSDDDREFSTITEGSISPVSAKKYSSFKKSRSSDDDREFSTITEGSISPVSAKKTSTRDISENEDSETPSTTKDTGIISSGKAETLHGINILKDKTLKLSLQMKRGENSPGGKSETFSDPDITGFKSRRKYTFRERDKSKPLSSSDTPLKYGEEKGRKTFSLKERSKIAPLSRSGNLGRSGSWEDKDKKSLLLNERFKSLSTLRAEKNKRLGKAIDDNEEPVPFAGIADDQKEKEPDQGSGGSSALPYLQKKTENKTIIRSYDAGSVSSRDKPFKFERKSYSSSLKNTVGTTGSAGSENIIETPDEDRDSEESRTPILEIEKIPTGETLSKPSKKEDENTEKPGIFETSDDDSIFNEKTFMTPKPKSGTESSAEQEKKPEENKSPIFNEDDPDESIFNDSTKITPLRKKKKENLPVDTALIKQVPFPSGSDIPESKTPQSIFDSLPYLHEPLDLSPERKISTDTSLRVLPPGKKKSSVLNNSWLDRFREQMDFDSSSALMDDYDRFFKDLWGNFLSISLGDKIFFFGILAVFLSVLMPWRTVVFEDGIYDIQSGFMSGGWFTIILLVSVLAISWFRYAHGMRDRLELLFGQVGISIIAIAWSAMAFSSALKIGSASPYFGNITAGPNYGVIVSIIACSILCFGAVIELLEQIFSTGKKK